MAKKSSNGASAILDDLSGESESNVPQMIRIEPVKYAVVEFTLTGTSPLMLGAWSEDSRRMLPDHPEKSAIKRKKERTDACKVADGKCYDHPDGGWALPAHMVKKCMMTAGMAFQVSGSKKTVGGILKGNALILGDSKDGNWIRLVSSGYEVDEKVGRNSGMGRTPRMIYRPRFDEWSCRVRVRFNTMYFDAPTIANILNVAGETVGVGEWRPEKGGNYGRFTVSQ